VNLKAGETDLSEWKVGPRAKSEKKTKGKKRKQAPREGRGHKKGGSCSKLVWKEGGRFFPWVPRGTGKRP